MNEAEQALGSDMLPKYEGKIHEKSASVLNSLFDQCGNKSYTFYEDEFRVHVKKQSAHPWIKPSNWNHTCVKTTFARASENDRDTDEDIAKLDKYVYFDEPSDHVVHDHLQLLAMQKQEPDVHEERAHTTALRPSSSSRRHARFFWVPGLAIATGFTVATVVRTKTKTQA